MDWKRYVLAFAAFVVLTFAFAAPWHLWLFKEVYDRLGAYTRAEPIFALGLLSIVLEGIVFVSLYARLRSNGHPAAEGATFGLLMGVFMGAYGALAVGAKMTVSSLPLWLLLEGSAFLIQFTLVGVVVGLICGRRLVTRPARF